MGILNFLHAKQYAEKFASKIVQIPFTLKIVLYWKKVFGLTGGQSAISPSGYVPKNPSFFL